MSVVDFKEIPEAHLSTGNQDVFELFCRDFLEAIGFKIIEGPGRGPDGGRDLIVGEKTGGIITCEEIGWVVSAKHKAHSGASINNDDEPDPIGRVRKFNAQGFMGFYSTIISGGLDDTFSRIRSQIKVYVYDRGRIESSLLSEPELKTIFQQYFPKSYSNWIDPRSPGETAYTSLPNEELKIRTLNLVSRIREFLHEKKRQEDQLMKNSLGRNGCF